MSNRVKGFTVVLDKDIRKDDVESLRQAICHMQHVLEVKNSLSTAEDWYIEQRVRREMGDKLWHVLYPPSK